MREKPRFRKFSQYLGENPEEELLSHSFQPDIKNVSKEELIEIINEELRRAKEELFSLSLPELKEAQVRIRGKYGIPISSDYLNLYPALAEEKILEMLRQEGVVVRSKGEIPRFWNEFPYVKAVSNLFERGDIFVSPGDLPSLIHEGIHAVQALRYPQMDIVQMEVEAYLSHWNMEGVYGIIQQRKLEGEKGSFFDFFEFFIGGSVRGWLNFCDIEELRFNVMQILKRRR